MRRPYRPQDICWAAVAGWLIERGVHHHWSALPFGILMLVIALWRPKVRPAGSDDVLLVRFVVWFVWQLPVAILEDYALFRRSTPRGRLWCFRMAIWANLDAGWAALTNRPMP